MVLGIKKNTKNTVKKRLINTICLVCWMSNGIVVVRGAIVEHALAISAFPSKKIGSTGYDMDLIYKFK